MNSDFILGAAVMLLILVALGLAGNEDYKSEIYTAAQTEEIKVSMRQMAINDANNEEANRQLYPHLDFGEGQ